MNDEENSFFNQSPDEYTLEQRLHAGGLLPGDEPWPDNLLSDPDGIISDWITGIRLETDADLAVHEHAIAQIRRLVPDTDEADRVLLMLGMIIHQAWLYTFMTQRANLHGGRLSQADSELLMFMEYKLTSICTILSMMTDEVDMTDFEGML